MLHEPAGSEVSVLEQMAGSQITPNAAVNLKSDILKFEFPKSSSVPAPDIKCKAVVPIEEAN